MSIKGDYVIQKLFQFIKLKLNSFLIAVFLIVFTLLGTERIVKLIPFLYHPLLYRYLLYALLLLFLLLVLLNKGSFLGRIMKWLFR